MKQLILSILLFTVSILPQSMGGKSGIRTTGVNLGRAGISVAGVTATGITATGGTITYSGGYTIHTFTTSGTFTVTSGSGDVDVFLVGGGASGTFASTGGGGGYTKTFKTASDGWKDGEAISISIGEYSVVVGSGGYTSGGYSEFINATYRANGASNANGGSAGGGNGNPPSAGASDGANSAGTGQGHTTRSFGENDGVLYAAGGGGAHTSTGYGASGGSIGGGTGESTYWGIHPTSGQANTGSGGGASQNYSSSIGGSGIVIIRYLTQ